MEVFVAAGSCAVCSDLRQLSSLHSCSGSGEIDSVLLARNNAVDTNEDWFLFNSHPKI